MDTNPYQMEPARHASIVPATRIAPPAASNGQKVAIVDERARGVRIRI